MAIYHFRIKSNKKPNGTKISAVQHVEYINREGKFYRCHFLSGLLLALKPKLLTLDTFLSSMKKPVEEIKRRLEQPDCRNNILLVAHQILQANTYARINVKTSVNIFIEFAQY